ncbi:MAG: hypothetical protein HYY06_30285 [Deltaproteobacteria bacterium]|nr:hypothetical protein [Deltaproteobacteria bacterium]
MRMIVTASFAVLLGCTGSHIGNPPAQLTLSVTGFDSAAPGALTLTSGVEIDDAWIGLSRIRLRAAEDCDATDARTDLEGPIGADLIEPMTLPSDLALEVAATAYCRIELDIAKIDADELPGVPADLDDRSALVRGRRADGVAFELATDFSDRFRLEAGVEPFAIPDGQSGLLLAFGLDGWIGADLLEEADVEERDGEPFIEIGDGENDEIEDAFRDAVRQSARLFRDLDLDGELSDDEREDTLALGTDD